MATEREFVVVDEPETFASIAALSGAVKRLTSEYKDTVAELLAEIDKRREADAEAEKEARAIAGGVVGKEPKTPKVAKEKKSAEKTMNAQLADSIDVQVEGNAE